MTNDFLIRKIAKPIFFFALLLPLLWIIWKVAFGDLGVGLNANPVEMVNRYLGDWALRFILLTLCITPLAVITGWSTPVRFRRMIGLFAFTYALLHVANYVIADQFLNWNDILADIIKRKYISVGMVTFIILLALAITSPTAVVKWLGAKRWRMVHRCVYLAGIGAVIHHWMMIKADLTQPIVHAVILGVLLIFRALNSLRKSHKVRPR
ncbi:MAG: sulfoxide reductase heme-binding subunit YedZ [Magnetovibrio sp.]|nr:sulfoxide reductase heme-binding subunit YedZ [Magnetovibrio sp.]|tara:strand:- start:243 stop:869 length:627 start_codon:yes stop_codon:yes gene_type:complete